jgi:hypothetical protein
MLIAEVVATPSGWVFKAAAPLRVHTPLQPQLELERVATRTRRWDYAPPSVSIVRNAQLYFYRSRCTRGTAQSAGRDDFG